MSNVLKKIRRSTSNIQCFEKKSGIPLAMSSVLKKLGIQLVTSNVLKKIRGSTSNIQHFEKKPGCPLLEIKF